MSRRISRRRFIAGAGAGAVVAAGGTAAVLAARGDGSKPADVVSTPSPGASPTPVATAAPARTQVAGGSATIVSPYTLGGDTFDVQLAGSPQVVEVLGRTHSRPINWSGRGEDLVPDLAQRWEMPDGTTVLLHLDPSARWQNRPPLNGRAVTAEDVTGHFRRTLELAATGRAPLAQRYHDYALVDSVDSPAAGVVRFKMKDLAPYFLGALAGEFSLIQAPEAVAAFSGVFSKLDSDHVVGSGPWTFEWTDDGGTFTAVRTGHRRPFLDSLRMVEPRDVGERLLAGELDEAVVRDRREAAAIREKLKPELFGRAGDIGDATQLAGNGAAYEFRRFEREVVMSSFFIGAPPWNNPELVQAISLALGRSGLAERLFGGRAEISRPVPPALASLDEVPTLAGWPGDHDSPQSRAEARQRWQAAGGPGLGTVVVDFPSVFDPLYSASSIVVEMLNEVLGPQFRPAVETYPTISKRVLEGHYGNGRAAFWFGWGAPLPGPSPAWYLSETYAPGSPGQRTVGGPGVVGTPTGRDGHLGIVPWVQQHAEVFRRPGVIADYPTPFWTQHLDYRRSG